MTPPQDPTAILSGPPTQTADEINAARPSDEVSSEEAAVVALNTRIKEAKNKSASDFKRMRENMNFAAGFQWNGQAELQSDRYVVNLTLRNVNQKVSTLYARDPVAEYVPRKRLEFQMYDGQMESILPVIQQGFASGMGMAGLPTEAQALLQDYQIGMNQRKMVKRVGKTLEIVYQWNFDEHDPEAKKQMKSLVRRVITCGVGYVRVGFEREGVSVLSSSKIGNSDLAIAQQIKTYLDQLDTMDKSSADMETLRQLMGALGVQIAVGQTDAEIKEKLIFDWPSSTSVIVDRRCRNLKGFVGAEWIAIEYVMPIRDVNAFFGVKLEESSTVVLYDDEGLECQGKNGTYSTNAANMPKEEQRCCLYELFNKQTQTCCFLVDGYKNYVRAPEPLRQKLFGFWPIQALTFNDCETEPGVKAPLYPPSDVELMRHPQKEWNRTREDLRSHRKANIPAYITMKNMISIGDKAKITNAVPNEVIELECSLPDGMTPDQLIAPKTKVPIDDRVYDTSPLSQDILYSVGAQEANLGAPNPQGTATGQQIAEQSRLTAGNSNVDDLDDLLSWMARVGGEICLQEFSPETVKRIAGPGAVFPTLPRDREDFLNAIYLKSKAGSSGRPNQTNEVNNWRLLAPILQSAGANPAFMVRETIRRADDQMDAEEAFPLMPMQQVLPQASPNAPDGVPDQSRPGPGITGPQEETGSVAVNQ